MRQRWTEKIGRNFINFKCSRICSNHFKSGDIMKVSGRKRLKEGAVPTLFERKNPERKARKTFPATKEER